LPQEKYDLLFKYIHLIILNISIVLLCIKKQYEIYLMIKKILPAYQGLDRRVYFLFIARIVTRMGDFVKIFLALILTKRLGIPETQVGLVLAAFIISKLLGNLTGGRLGDTKGRRFTILTSHFVSGTLYIASGFMLNSPLLILLLIPAGFTLGFVRPATQALIADISRGDKRQKAMSLLYLGTNLGVAIGPIIAGFLFERYPAWIFWGDGLTALLCGLIILFNVKEPSHQTRIVDSELEQEDLDHSLRAFIKRPILITFAFLSLFLGLVYSQHAFALPLYLEAAYQDKGALFYGWIMSFNAIIVVTLTPLTLHFTHKRPEAENMALGTGIMALGFGLLLLPIGLWVIALSVLLWTLGEILFVTNFSVFNARYTPVNHRSRFSSYSGTILHTGDALGPVLGGLSLQYLDFNWHWSLILITGALTASGFLLLQRYLNHKVPA